MSKPYTKLAKLSVRVTAAEKAALQALARSRGLTLSEFIVSACKALGTQVAENLQEVVDLQVKMARRKPVRRRKEDQRKDLGVFKVPYLQAREAAPFEGVVRYVAREMRADEMTVGILMTHLGEAIGDVLACGQVFRWPGMFVVGPYLVETSDGAHCVPRFQASPLLKNHVLWNCEPDRACNRTLDAHRRRRRRDRQGTLRSLMESTRHTIAKQDLRMLEHLSYFDSNWRDFSPTHEQ